MGALLGLTLGIGLFLTVTPRRRTSRRVTAGSTVAARLSELLARADLLGVTPVRFGLACLTMAAIGFVVLAAVSGSPVIATAFAVLAGYAPMGALLVRARRRQDALRDLWPDAVDNLASGVRAGLSLPEALTQLGQRGPEALRPAFQRFGEDYRATGRFGWCLDRLKAELAEPVADRIVESLRIASEVGGTDLGRLLRTLSSFLREDARTRAELESRQTWTVNAARLAVAAPWLLLGMLSLRPEAVDAYDSAAGVIVLAGGALACVVAYRLMMRIGRLPREQRVLR